MSDAAYEAYEEITTVLGRIKSLLHGIYASAEFDSDKSAELKMMAMAEELTEEAQELADSLYGPPRGKGQAGLQH